MDHYATHYSVGLGRKDRAGLDADEQKPLGVLSQAVGALWAQVLCLKLSCFVASCQSLPPKPKPFPPTEISGHGGQGAASSCSVAVGRTLLLTGRHDPKHKPHVFTFLCVVGKHLSAIQNSVNTCWKLHSKSPYVPEEMPNKVMIALYVHS